MAEIGHIFNNSDLLRHALTHSSLVGGNSRHINPNERQEFLGDRVLGLIVADMLMARFPNENEGDISRRHAALVRMETLGRVAGDLDLGRHVKLSLARNTMAVARIPPCCQMSAKQSLPHSIKMVVSKWRGHLLKNIGLR